MRKKRNIYLPILSVVLVGPLLYRSASKLPIFLEHPDLTWIIVPTIIIFIVGLCNILYVIERKIEKHMK